MALNPGRKKNDSSALKKVLESVAKLQPSTTRDFDINELPSILEYRSPNLSAERQQEVLRMTKAAFLQGYSQSARDDLVAWAPDNVDNQKVNVLLTENQVIRKQLAYQLRVNEELVNANKELLQSVIRSK